MANYEATRYDFDAANLTGIQGVNTGIIIPWSSVTIPSGFLECDGAAVSRTTYSALFAVVSTTYGIGDGSTTFNIPDLKGACCQNSSPTKTHGTSGGANTVSLSGNIAGSLSPHTLSTPEIAAHTHTRNSGGGGFSGQSTGGASASLTSSGSTGGGGAHTHSLSANFVGDAASTLQPYLVLVYVIKT